MIPSSFVLGGELQIPENAELNLYGNDWRCKRGYERRGEKCFQIKLPDNAELSFHGGSWQCKKGFYKEQDKCFEVPENAKSVLQGNGWVCEKNYKKGYRECLPMSPEEIKEQKIVQDAAIKYMEAQKMLKRTSLGISGSSCDRELETNIEVCVSIIDADFSCQKHYKNEKYQSCKVDVNYKMSTDHESNDPIKVDTSCTAKIKYSRPQENRSKSDERDYELYAHDTKLGKMTLRFNFYPGSKVVKASVVSISCDVRKVKSSSGSETR